MVAIRMYSASANVDGLESETEDRGHKDLHASPATHLLTCLRHPRGPIYPVHARSLQIAVLIVCYASSVRPSQMISLLNFRLVGRRVALRDLGQTLKIQTPYPSRIPGTLYGQGTALHWRCTHWCTSGSRLTSRARLGRPKKQTKVQ